MDPKELQYHVEGTSGALLTRFWPGSYKRAFSPLTHAVMAARTPGGVILVRRPAGNVWELPGGARSRGEHAGACAARRFKYQTGLHAGDAAVIGYYRLLVDASVEYGALVFCRSQTPQDKRLTFRNAQVRTWGLESTVADVDPVAATLAALAGRSRAWRVD